MIIDWQSQDGRRYRAQEFVFVNVFPPGVGAVVIAIVRQIMRQHALSSKMDIGI